MEIIQIQSGHSIMYNGIYKDYKQDLSMLQMYAVPDSNGKSR